MFQKLFNLFRKKKPAPLVDILIVTGTTPRKKPAGVSIPVPPKRPEVRMARGSEPVRNQDPAPEFRRDDCCSPSWSDTCSYSGSSSSSSDSSSSSSCSSSD